MGSLEYKQNVDIQFLVGNKIPTDGLVVRGWYSTVTLAIYGNITGITVERTTSPPPPPQNTNKASIEACSPTNFDQSTSEPVASAKWERPIRTDIIESSPSQSSVHPNHGSDPRIFNEHHQLPHPPEPRHMYKERTPFIEHHSPPVIPLQVGNVRPGYKKYENFPPKQWAGPDDHFHKKPHEPYERSHYEPPPPSESPYHARNPPPPQLLVWEKKPEVREPEEIAPPFRSPPIVLETTNKDKEIRSHRSDFEEERKVLLKDPKRRDHHELSEGFGREVEWNKESRAREKEYERNKRDRASRDGRNVLPIKPRDSSHDRKVDLAPRRPSSPISPTRALRQPKTPPPEPQDLPAQRKIGPQVDPNEEFDGNSTEKTPIAGEDMFEPVSPDQSPGDVYNSSDGELQENLLAHLEDDGYEEILSEEEEMSDGEERNIEMGDMDYDLGDESWNISSAFNPFQCELTSLLHFHDPTLSVFEINHLNVIKEEGDKNEITEEPQKLITLLKSFADKEHNEKWVEAVETVSTLINSGLSLIGSKEVYDETLQTILEWQKEGLNYEAAIRQPLTPFKVRHIKAGIKLATELFQTNGEIVKKLIDQGSVKQLLELYSKSFMSLPLKLLIIRCIDAVTYTSEGLSFFLENKILFDSDHTSNLAILNDTDINESEVICLTGYQRLWRILQFKEPTRAVIAMESLMNKLHLYEVLEDFRTSVQKLAEAVNPQTTSYASLETNIHHLICCLTEISNIFQETEKNIAQLVRYLPAVIQFEVPKALFDPYPGLYRMFRDCQLLQCIFVLLTIPVTAGNTSMALALTELLSQFLLKNSGLMFLINNPEVINGIHRALFQAADESREESGDESISHQLGLNLVCALQAFQHVDTLMAYHQGRSMEDKKDLDVPEAVASLHNLYSMTFGSISKMAVVAILSMEANLNALIPFVESTNTEEGDTKLSKSVCCGYATELLIFTVHHADNMDLINNFGDKLISLSQQVIKLSELSRWMCPVKTTLTLTHENVNYLMVSYVKKYMEDAAKLPPELITALRILEHIVVPNKGLKKDEPELKYKYAMLQLFANDALDNFLTILQHVYDFYLKQAQNTVSLVSQQGALVLAIVKPVISLLRVMLSHLINARGTEFKDLTAVPILLKLHTLLCLFPMSSYVYPRSQQIQNSIIKILLAFTQPILGLAESEEAISKSLWTQMVGEVLKYTVIAPNCWMTGLTVLSELLPLPLPLQTKEVLSSEDIKQAINCRKLWSAHLNSLTDFLQQVIVNMAATSCQPLQQLLRRICVQLSDLAPPTAIVVVRAVLDVFNESTPCVNSHLGENTTKDKKTLTPINPPVVSTPETSTTVEMTPCSLATSRILDFMSYMVSNATFKITLLHILAGSVKTNEKYNKVMFKLTTLLNLPSTKAYHQHAQENIVSIFQSLCDPEIGLVTLENGSVLQEILSNSLPTKELISQMVNSLVLHIGNKQHPFASVLPSLRTLVMITDHDLGIACLKSSLESKMDIFPSLFQRLSSSFSKVSSDCLSTLSTALELLRLLVQVYEEPQPVTSTTPLRTLTLSPAELVPILQWKAVIAPGAKEENTEEIKIEKEEKKTDQTAVSEIVQDKNDTLHPLVQLEKQLTECLNDEDVLESLLDSLQGIVSTLNEGLSIDKSEKEFPDPTLPNSESLATQFSARSVFLVGEVEEERLSPSYWLSMLGVEDSDQEMEQVQMDLLTFSEKYCPEFDIKAGLLNLCFLDDTSKDTEGKKKVETSSGKRHYTTSSNSEAPIKKPFTAPMRGRGFSRGAQHQGRSNDPFRSRPPNTSRPPSMHVDDFVAMEYQGPTPLPMSGPVKRSLKEAPRGRGRGFDPSRGFPPGRGGRFLSPPSAYGRRESSRGPFPFDTGSVPRSATRPIMSAWAGRSGPVGLQKPHLGLHTFSRGSHIDSRGLSGQRPRDPYTLINTTGNSGAARFARSSSSTRSTGGGSGGSSPSMGGGVIGSPSHWSDPRMKIPEGRFLPTSAAVRGRREILSRHARSFTR